MKKTRHLFGIYVVLALIFLVGWLPEEEAADSIPVISKNVIIKITKEMKHKVQETSFTMRKINEQNDENIRRNIQIKKMKKKRKKKIYRMTIDKSSRSILERIVEAEAGDQDIKGRQLVANVIINRVKSGKFPDTVKGVVFSPGQFSPVSNGRYYNVNISGKTRQAVEKALKEKDNSQGALYFMCRSASSPENVAWFDRDLTRLLSYGCHEFFR